jgi:hypothetical protein
LAKNLTAVLAHNAVANAQAQASPFAHFFSGEEWIENPIRMRDSWPVVTKKNLN